MTIPCDLHSESMILARMLGSVNASNSAIESLKSDDFHDPLHGAIFSSMSLLWSKDCEIEPVAVSTVLKKEFPAIADTAYVFGLEMHQYGTSEDVKLFIENIKEASRLKKLIYIGAALAKDAGAKTKNSDELHSESLTKLETVFSADFEKSCLSLSELMRKDYAESGKDLLKFIEDRQNDYLQGIKALRGIPTGFTRLDDLLSGLCRGHYVIIGARPGVGKTTFALNLIHNLINRNIPVGFFSLEMTAQEAMIKLIGIDSGVDMEKALRGEISMEYQKIVASAHFLENRCLIIDDQESLRVSTLISRAKRMVAVNHVQAIFIDYIGEVRGEGKFTNKQEEIQSVSKALRGMAKKLKIPVVCIAQLNRDSEKTNRAPLKSDLRESGQIEADAHSILLMHNPSVEDKKDQPGLVYVNIVKNRFGKTGAVHFGFEGAKSKFLEMDYRLKEPEE